MPTTTDYYPATITGVLLAGGRSQRMGVDKACINIDGQTLLQRCKQRLAAQVEQVLISSNDPDSIARLTDASILSDDNLNGQLNDYSGPLVGILTALLWLKRNQPEQQWLLSVAVDTPLFPHTLANDLLLCAKNQQRLLVCASSNQKQHPTCALWHTALIKPLTDYLLAGERRLMRFHSKHNAGFVDYAGAPYDPFLNLNTAGNLVQFLNTKRTRQQCFE